MSDDSKGIKDNKCLQNIDFSPIEKKIEELEKKIASTVSYDDFVIEITPPTNTSWINSQEVKYEEVTCTKAGYYPLVVFGEHWTDGRVHCVPRSSYFKSRELGKCVIVIEIINQSDQNNQPSQAKAYVLWVKVKNAITFKTNEEENK